MDPSPQRPPEELLRPPLRFALLASDPPPPPGEVELAAGLVLEIAILWGGETLSIAHERLPGDFSLGGERCVARGAWPDAHLPAPRVHIASATRTRVWAIIAPDVEAWLARPGTADPVRVPGPEAASPARGGAAGGALPSPGGRRVALSLGCRVYFCFGSLGVRIAPVRPGKPSDRRPLSALASRSTTYLAGAIVFVGGLLIALSMTSPPRRLDFEESHSQRVARMKQYIAAAAARDAELARRTRAVTPLQGRERAAGGGGRAEVEPTASGDGIETNLEKALRIESNAAANVPARRASEERPRELAKARARAFGVQLLERGDGRFAEAIRFGRELSRREVASMKEIFRNGVGDYVAGGLAPSGAGLGGGGRGEGADQEGIPSLERDPGESLARVVAADPRLARLPDRRPRPDPSGRGAGAEQAIVGFLEPHARKLGGCYRAAAPEPLGINRRDIGQLGFAREGAGPSVARGGEAARRRPAANARVRLVIAADGRVLEVSVHDEANPSPPIIDCLRDVLRGVVFPPLRSGPKVVSYPLAAAM